ncbi:MAG: hypothetical protein ABDH32_04475, partial [Candidatus Caldarchaeales archaeon]
MPLESDLLTLTRNILNNPLVRGILRRLAEEDPHGYCSKLDHALALMAGEASGKGISLECIISYN